MNKRLKTLRNELGLKQGDFALKVSTTQGHISDIENGRKELSDRMIKLICLQFSVNEDWLRTGEGKMFAEQETFSLDDYAKRSNLSTLEKKIIKGYMDLAPETRENLIDTFKNVLQEENTLEEVAEEISPEIQLTKEDESELEKIRQEMLDKKKGTISSVSTDINDAKNA